MQDDLFFLGSLLQETRNLVAFHRHCELDYPLSPALKTFLNPAPAKGKTKPVPPSPAAETAKPAETIGPDRADRQTLDDLKHTLESCQLCPLGKSRQIFGEGSVRQGLALLIISEPPGAEEMAANRPISGAPRELLEKMLGAINLSLDDIFLTNIVKCAPPAERGATVAETSACLPYLIRQIELIKPKIICTMGQLAGQSLLKTSQSLLSLRGKFHDFQGIPLMATFHPALLLKTQELKKGAWHDLQMIQKKLKSLA
ncbi:MAG: uracil-DNA glycosylase [Desulfobulbaceae bacterium]|nr:uracil-DNA glycosylase [Desulfobulbaceae bacterium]